MMQKLKRPVSILLVFMMIVSLFVRTTPISKRGLSRIKAIWNTSSGICCWENIMNLKIGIC